VHGKHFLTSKYLAKMDEGQNRMEDIMPIPKPETFLLPILKVLADGANHNVGEIREHMKVQFQLTISDLAKKHRKGMPVFVNRVAWALAHLNMHAGPVGHPRLIRLVKKENYKITEHGKRILKSNPTSLTFKDLRKY
jgi:restriction system protein